MKSFCFLAFLVIVAQTNALLECNTDDDCAPSTATCVNQFCQCSHGEVLNYDGTKCLSLVTAFEGSCEINEQCSLIGGAVLCKDNTCQCADDHVYLKKQCIQKLLNFRPCDDNDDCFDGLDYNSRICKESMCQCAEGYYNRAGVDCRRKAALSEKCALNIDCQDEGAICSLKTCVLSTSLTSNLTEFMTFVEDDESIESIEQINNIKQDGIKQNEFCTLGADTCTENNESIEQIKNIKQDEIQLNEFCTPGADTCADAKAVCNPTAHKCLCRNGYFEKSGACIAELGMSCTDNQECASKQCLDNVCGCAVGSHFNNNNTLCRQAAYQNGDELTCNSADSCRMLNSRYWCDSSSVNKICRCDEGYAVSADYICEVSCTSDIECPFEHQVCDTVLHKCMCTEDYELEDSVCKPRIGGVCATTEECKAVVKDSLCKDNVCVCEPHFAAHARNCFPDIKIDNECEHQEQCEWKYNSTCTQVGSSKICKCDDGYMNIDGNCLRIATHIEDYCTHPWVCPPKTRCVNSKCKCQDGYKASKDKVQCLLKGTADDDSAASTTTASAVCLAAAVIIAIILAQNN